MGTVVQNICLQGSLESTNKIHTMKLFILVLALASSQAFDLDTEWEDFKYQYGKQYLSQEEHNARKAVFAGNLILIAQHNAEEALGLHTFTLGVNEFADMSSEEFGRYYNGLAGSPTNNLKVKEIVADNLPDTVDWRDHGYVTPVKNQKQCGSCWAFSATGSMEGAHFKKTGKLVSLSEQNLVDCVTKDFGCNGGLPGDAFQYVIKNHGIDTETSYPYTARDGQCHYSSATEGATFSEAVAVESKNEDALKKAVATVGPVSVGIDASHFSFQLYKRGVYYCRFCSQTRLDHGVLVVGYGNEDGHDYWMVKNSWGSNYGENGYIKMSRNRNNNCGIATMANYPVA